MFLAKDVLVWHIPAQNQLFICRQQGFIFFFDCAEHFRVGNNAVTGDNVLKTVKYVIIH